MKKVSLLLALGIVVLGMSTAHALPIIYQENFDGYTGYPISIAGVPGTTTVPWSVYGRDVSTADIVKPSSNGYVEITFNNDYADAFIGGLIHNDGNPPSTTYDLSLPGTYIEFDIKSNLDDPLLAVMTPQIADEHVSVMTGDGPAYKSAQLLTAQLLMIPEESAGWVHYKVSVADLKQPGDYWSDLPNLTSIERINLLFLSLTNDIQAGTIVDIDNIVVAIPEPATMILLGSALLGVFGLRKRNK